MQQRLEEENGKLGAQVNVVKRWGNSRLPFIGYGNEVRDRRGSRVAGR
jgi:hypothetical protein